MSIYHDDRKILDNTKIIKIIITKLLSLCLTTEIFEDKLCMSLYIIWPFWHLFVSKMEDETGSVHDDNRKILDDTKIIKINITQISKPMFDNRNFWIQKLLM